MPRWLIIAAAVAALAILVCIGVAVLGVAILLRSSPARNLAETTPVVKTSVKEFVSEWRENGAKFYQKYKGRCVEVVGAVHEIGQDEVTLWDGEFLDCQSENTAELVVLHKRQKVTVKGIVDGSGGSRPRLSHARITAN